MHRPDKHITQWLFIGIMLILVWPVMAQDEADEPLPVIPYYTSSESGQQFNIPIPSGWAVTSPDDEEFVILQSPGAPGEIAVLAVEEESATAAIERGLARVDPERSATLLLEDTVNIDGITWTKTIYDLAAGGTLTAFSQQRDDVFYLLMFLNPQADIDFYMLASTGEDIDDTVPVEAVLREIYPEFDAEPDATREVELSNGTWIRSEYSFQDEPLYTLHQSSFGTTYAVIQFGGEGDMLDSVNKALFTVLLGFFVTPQNTNFLTLGLIASFGLLAVLVGSILLRHRSLKKDIELMEQLRQQG
ncbi:MAG: hypothetical protein ACOCX5_02895 [Chloroflexota bacterium]